jgi:SAM-dependent MidA family methyltransferase
VTIERLDHFMARANAAYYATHDPFADFTTAPEIGQVFGELLGAWSVIAWHALRRPDPVILAELGPGRGTLMTDALRTIARTAPDFAACLRVHFVETSPRLATLLRDRIPDITIHASAEHLPDAPTILLANEFLDALPIRQFVHRADGWTERHVEAFRFVERPAAPPAPIPDGLAEGDIVEHSEASHEVVRTLAARAAAGRLIALLLDYGGDHGDTLQALRQGKPAPPLDAPGSADLTAHVDFAALAATAEQAGARAHGPLPQGLFLTRLGLYERTRQLIARNTDSAATLLEAANRLAQPERMGVLFKALAITPPAMPAPPGFEAA